METAQRRQGSALHVVKPGEPDPQVVATMQRGLAAGLRFELALDSFFGASHAVRPNGEKHTHSYRVQAVFETDCVDEQGMVAGFREVKALLEREAKKYANRFLNEIPPFDVVQPTGENVAAVIFRNLAAALLEEMPGGPELVAVTLWENPTIAVRVLAGRAAA